MIINVLQRINLVLVFIKKQRLGTLNRSKPLFFAQNTEGGIFASNLLKINTLNWQKGIYFLKITDGQKVFQEKVLKQ